MKRTGVFCDHTIVYRDNHNITHTDPCPHLAAGECAGCGKDTCNSHGSDAGLALSIQRLAERTTTPVEIAREGTVFCWQCLSALSLKPSLFTEHVVPILKAHLVEAVRAALAADALAEDKK